MKTLYIHRCIKTRNLPEAGRYFVIGVRGQGKFSLERLHEIFPDIKIERLPETINHKYIAYGSHQNHILQPAFVTIPEGKV